VAHHTYIADQFANDLLTQVVVLLGSGALAQSPSNDASAPAPASGAPPAAPAAPAAAAAPAAPAAAASPDTTGNNCPEWSFIDNRQPLLGMAQSNRPNPPAYTGDNNLTVLDARRYLFEPLNEVEMLTG
jgi:hypothetical protein